MPVRLPNAEHVPTEAASPTSTPSWSPPPRLVARARRAGFGQGLVMGALGTIVAWFVAEAAPGRIADNVAFIGIGVSWLLALVMGAGAGAVVRHGLARRFFDDDDLARASFVLPALGLALLGPISLHALVLAVPAVLGENADEWLVFAFAGTLHAHVAFALSMVVEALHVADDGQRRKVVLWPAVLISFVPGALIVFPPVLVWVCGLIVSRAFMARAVRWYRADHDDVVASTGQAA
jgi:hypothetical protein